MHEDESLGKPQEEESAVVADNNKESDPPEAAATTTSGGEAGGAPAEDSVILENSNTNFPAIWSEEGKYLANVLGDALVKGLSLVSQQRPTDPVEYLANYLRKYKDGEEGEDDGTGEDGQVVVAAAAAVVQLEDGATEPMEEEQAEDAAAEPPPPPSSEQPPPAEDDKTIDNDLTQGYDRLEDALDEEESASASPFDPLKEEQAERLLLESSRGSALDPNGEDGESGGGGSGGGGGGAISMHNSTRDESGQSVLHFACTRPGGGSTILAFLQNPSVNLSWRDVAMRTARDIASNLNRLENVRVIDSWVQSLAQRNDIETIQGLIVDGYDHVADVEDNNSGQHIVEVAEAAGNRECALVLRAVPEFRERVERCHRCVRSGDIEGVKNLVGQDKRVAYALSPRTGRNALHVAVLCEEVPIVKWLADNVPEAVKKGDNLERTCLHYAMGVDKVEKIVRILVRAGAKRVVRDLRERQPSFYWSTGKEEIAQLQAEERAIVN